MNAYWKNRLLLVLLAAVAVGLILTARWQPAQAQREGAQPGRYSVIETEGHNLIVTDNTTNTLYFYTIDKDKEIGSDLKLRASLDLNQVGKPVIKPTSIKANP
jgi:hypothetical protein